MYIRDWKVDKFQRKTGWNGAYEASINHLYLQNLYVLTIYTIVRAISAPSVYAHLMLQCQRSDSNMCWVSNHVPIEIEKTSRETICTGIKRISCGSRQRAKCIIAF